ncbi:hypothetical protein [Rhodococcoides yunnanense]|uniref:Uncharacterized protein n=1 Tax=Rhodococcoides yunnanense TaxID=278209 RepID=A0ABU4BJF2_9NOCA|nr:hypothetical protein [Rhodococcus yunnanensis]MDV6264351.1 hypothetical protein [Rhodococcus yunnanensis]
MRQLTAMTALAAMTLSLAACSTGTTSTDRPLVDSAVDLVAPGTVNVGDT